jgi:hypothetical protein
MADTAIFLREEAALSRNFPISKIRRKLRKLTLNAYIFGGWDSGKSVLVRA